MLRSLCDFRSLGGDVKEGVHDGLLLEIGTRTFVHTHDVGKDASTLLVNDVEASHQEFEFKALGIGGAALGAKLGNGGGEVDHFRIHCSSVVEI